MRRHVPPALRLFHAANEWVAVEATRVFGSMPTFYLLCGYGLLPALPALRSRQDLFLYVGNVIQLVSLPLLAVGQQVLGRASERRAEKDHERLLAIEKSLARIEARLESLR